MTLRHRPWAEQPPGFNIGLRPIEPAHWLEGGGADAERKARLRLKHPDLVWGETEGSRAGQEEVLRLVEAKTGQRGDPALEPLWAASLLVADDLCLMERREAGWTLTAVSLCSPTLFTVAESLGKPLRGLHEPVPNFEERFLWRVERMFDNLPADRIVERRNWTVLNSDELFLPSSGPIRALIPEIRPSRAQDELYVRVERQTLRVLETGGILFTIRIWMDKLAELRGHPELMTAFAKAWREAPPDFRSYKGLAHYDHLIEAFLGDAG
jgi:hypothetical protein